MPTVKELQERRAPIGKRIREMADKINAENRDFTPTERSEWDRINSEFNGLSGQIEAGRRSAEVDTELESRRDRPPPAAGTETRNGVGKMSADEREERSALAIQAWFRHQSGKGLTDAHRRACRRLNFNPARRALDLTLPARPHDPDRRSQKRAMSATIGSDGAFTIQTGTVQSLEKALKDYNGVRAVAHVIRTDTGADIPWPTNNDTVNKGRMLGENQQITETKPTFGQTLFGAFKFTSDLVLVPSEFLEDTALNFAAEIGPMLGERIARGQEDKFTTGTGASEPQGVVTGSKLGKTAASNTGFTGDEIIDLIHSVDPAYRRDPSFRLMFHDKILAVIRKLKDSQNRYLFEEGQNGAPPKIKGVEYVINQNMADTISSGTKSILAGAFKKYKVRDVNKVRIMRLDERYADYDQVGFVAFMRSDGRVLDAGTGPIKHLVH